MCHVLACLQKAVTCSNVEIPKSFQTQIPMFNFMFPNFFLHNYYHPPLDSIFSRHSGTIMYLQGKLFILYHVHTHNLANQPPPLPEHTNDICTATAPCQHQHTNFPQQLWWTCWLPHSYLTSPLPEHTIDIHTEMHQLWLGLHTWKPHTWLRWWYRLGTSLL